jgi:hypothetical protein
MVDSHLGRHHAVLKWIHDAVELVVFIINNRSKSHSDWWVSTWITRHRTTMRLHGNKSYIILSILEYLLLENVVGDYKYPCILDLKMGTEKHKDYIISQEEADRRQARWDKSTSKSLGVRVCGMKVSSSLLLSYI